MTPAGAAPESPELASGETAEVSFGQSDLSTAVVPRIAADCVCVSAASEASAKLIATIKRDLSQERT